MGSSVQRLVAAVMVAALACAPALLGACAVECVRGIAHVGLPQDMAAATSLTPGPETDGAADDGEPTAGGSAAHAHVAGRHHGAASAVSAPSVPSLPTSTIAVVENCCSDAAVAAIPARLADRSATILLGAAVDVTPVYVVAVAGHLPERVAPLSARIPRGAPLVLRI